MLENKSLPYKPKKLLQSLLLVESVHTINWKDHFDLLDLRNRCLQCEARWVPQ